jgi:hypothetical protein
MGRQYHDLVTGSEETSTGPGVFAEAYWNGGWPMLAAVGLYIGLLFAILGRLSRTEIAKGHLVVLPLSFLTIILALRIEGWFAATYVGGVAQLLLIYALLAVMNLPTPWWRHAE